MSLGRVQPTLGLSFPWVRRRDELAAVSQPGQPLFSESVAAAGARCIGWASTFLLSPAGKGAAFASREQTGHARVAHSQASVPKCNPLRSIPWAGEAVRLRVASRSRVEAHTGVTSFVALGSLGSASLGASGTYILLDLACPLPARPTLSDQQPLASCPLHPS